ncbi:DBR1-domain-containing protein [Canariomyces notabilis]|uniref:DBR1-domain-containing protein n=1 Tax=Canariomyces notabilis TaxID=2074819 RepID=A0AAN6QEF9_9PEZI|nr:DBR1-domain-containing protein [Canariomyces arenarius]
MTSSDVRVAIEGCGHGTLNAIYAAVERSCQERGWDGVDLLIIGGDFQAVRNAADLNVMSVPLKYRALGDFHEYYSGSRKAPYLTIFVGGNHEASAHLWELYYGGWVTPNIYYMGAANVLRLGGLRIAGMSGIFKGFDYKKQHHERLPFNADDIKSFYHTREIDVRKLLQLRTQVDIGISHDWPRRIEKHGDQEQLFRMKPAFRSESRDGTLGNPAAEYVLNRLRPPYWFSAHMHCKFAAIKTFDPPTEGKERAAQPTPQATGEAEAEAGADIAANPEEIDLDIEEDIYDEGERGAEGGQEQEAPKEASTEELRAQLPAAFAKPVRVTSTTTTTTPGQPVPAGITNLTTRFLALDKCLPGRDFLQLMEIPATSTSTSTVSSSSSHTRPFRLQYDPEWLAITRVFHPLLTIGDRDATTPPDLGEAHYLPLIEAEEKWVEEHIVSRGRLDVPTEFVMTAPPHQPGIDPERLEDGRVQPEEYTNPQTAAFCELIGVPNLWDATEEERAERKAVGPAPGGYRPPRGGRGLRTVWIGI